MNEKELVIIWVCSILDGSYYHDVFRMIGAEYKAREKIRELLGEWETVERMDKRRYRMEYKDGKKVYLFGKVAELESD